MPETILIVDDEYANRFLLEQILFEYNPVSIPSADQMWDYLKKEKKADLILLDVMMPGQNGFESARMLRENPEYADIPVIFVTPRSEAEDPAKGFDLGGYDYIKKPFDSAELIARVKAALKKRKDQQVLNDFALKDSLTGLYNRRYLDELSIREADKLFRGLMTMAAAMCDIDHFKEVNDVWGHLCGDYLLRKFSEVIMKSLRTYDTAIRYGGEEFLIFFPHLNKTDAEIALERVRELHRNTEYFFEGAPVLFTFSGGISDSSEFPPTPSIVHDMIRSADARLYTAKQNGRNRIVIF